MSYRNNVDSLTPAVNGSHQEAGRILRNVVEQGSTSIAAVTGGATVDAEARTAIAAILASLRAKGILQ